MQYYLLAFQKYAQFSGRATRTEYWMFILFDLLIRCFFTLTSVILGYVGESVSSSANTADLPINSFSDIISVIFLASLIYGLATFIPNIALTTRRLHDIGKSGWLQLIALIPVIGWILALVWFCTPSDEGENDYGKLEDTATQEDL